jgi:hypothetical protein
MKTTVILFVSLASVLASNAFANCGLGLGPPIFPTGHSICYVYPGYAPHGVPIGERMKCLDSGAWDYIGGCRVGVPHWHRHAHR